MAEQNQQPKSEPEPEQPQQTECENNNNGEEEFEEEGSPLPYLDDLVELPVRDELLFFLQFFLHLLTLYSLCYICSMRRFLSEQSALITARLGHWSPERNVITRTTLPTLATCLPLLSTFIRPSLSSVLFLFSLFYPSVFPARRDDYIDRVNGVNGPALNRRRPRRQGVQEENFVVAGQGHLHNHQAAPQSSITRMTLGHLSGAASALWSV